jgi:DNA-directed RNA polymerase subunit RPC12/RpoP
MSEPKGEAVRTAEERVRAAVPDAVLKKMPGEKTHWSIWGLIRGRGMWLTSKHRFADPIHAWEKALKHPSVVAFEARAKGEPQPQRYDIVCGECGREVKSVAPGSRITCGTCGHVWVFYPAAQPLAGEGAPKLNQYGLTPSEWSRLVEVGSSLHDSLMAEPEGEDWYDGQSLKIMEYLVQAFKLASLKPEAPEGAKVTWRVGVSMLPSPYDWIMPNDFDSEAEARESMGEPQFPIKALGLLRITTTEEVVAVREAGK